jgi:hypothetical protein
MLNYDWGLHLQELSRMVESLEQRTLLAGDYSFAVAMGGLGVDAYTDVAADGAGNAIVTGLFTGAVDFDPGAGQTLVNSRRGQNAFLAKYSAAGALQWVVSYGKGPVVTNVAADAAGNVYVTGRFAGLLDVAPGPEKLVLTSEGGTDAFVVKLSSSGALLWASQFGGTGDVSPRDIEVGASDGYVYLAGDFTGTVDAAPGRTRELLTSLGSTDAVAVKLSGATGKLAWAAQQGGAGQDGARGVAVDATTGDAIIAGEFSGTADLRPGKLRHTVTSAEEFDGFNAYVSKLSVNGKFTWAQTYASGQDALDTSEVEVDGAGNVWALGSYSGAANQGTWLWKLNGAGTTQLQRLNDRQSGTTDADLALDAAGNVYLAGYFSGSADFDPGAGTAALSAFGGSDAYVLKLNSAGNFVYARQLGGAGNDYGAAIGLDAAGNIFAAGTFIGTADFDPGAGTQSRTSAGDVDGWLVRLTA